MAIRRTGAATTINRSVTAAAVTPVNIITGTGGPSVNISSIQIANSGFTALDDTAVNTTGGYIIINGTGFQSGATVRVQGTSATSVAFVSSSRLNVTVPAISSGTLDIYVINPDGSGAILLSGFVSSGVPSWTTTSPLTQQDVDTTFSIQLAATGDGSVTYAVSSGSTLPSGTSLASNGLFSGTVTGLNEDTTYTFSVDAIDSQNQETARTFNITVTAGDQYYYLTTLHLSGEAPANNWLTDASTNKFALTVNGDTRPMAFSPYETVWSNFFDGTGDRLSLAGNSAFDISSGNFTIEFWAYSQSNAATQDFFTLFTSTNNNYAGLTLFISRLTNSTVKVEGASPSIGGGAPAFSITTNTTAPIHTWTHVAVTRSGSTFTCWINGVSAGTATFAGTLYWSPPVLYIGSGNDSATNYFTGYISNVRIVKGTAVYTENFTPPTSPLTAIANTSLLTCQSNRLIDNSTNNFTLTKNGDVLVSNFGPFTETDLVTGSAYFDGTGDYLTIPNSTTLDLESGNFTIEMFLYPLSNPAEALPLARTTNGSSYSYAVYLTFGTVNFLYNGLTTVTGSATAPLNTWTHVAFVKNSGTLTIYVNGNSAGSGSVGTIATSSRVTSIGGREDGLFPFTGYISNARVVKGTAVYTSNFTPPTSPLTAVANTSILTLQNRFGENNNRFVDSSGVNNLTTRVGNATQGTFSPFSQMGWSNYFDGTGDSLGVPANTAFSFGTGDFTYEAWIYPTSDGSSGVFRYIMGAGGSGQQDQLLINSAGNRTIYYYDGTTAFTTSNQFTLNSWNHVAVSRNSGTLRVFINGVQGVSGSSSTNITVGATNTFYIGNRSGGSESPQQAFIGYISNLRVLKGTGLYTTGFTPSTSPLTAIANTSLLTCQSNNLKDNSNNNFTITRNGDVSVQAFGPFKPTTEWSANTVGGSMYFDGTGDYLTVPNNTSLQMGSGDFTIEFWIRYNSITSYQTPFSKGYTAAGDLLLQTGNGNGVMTVWISGSAVITESTGATVGQWYHYALVRKGTTVTLYRNGVSRGTATSSVNFNTTDQAGIGATGKAPGGESVGAFPVNGYMSNVRVIKGTALYTSAFTPPTSPPTPIAGTTLLLNGTNGGIIDYTSRNNFETVGNVQLRNNTSKYGNTSIYFDGTDDALTAPYSPLFNLGTGPFTIEAWVNFSDLSSNRIIFDTYTSAATGGGYQLYWRSTGTSIAFYGNGTVIAQSTFTSHVTGTWYHISVTRDSVNSLRIFVDGTQYANTTYSTALNIASTAKIGVGMQISTSTNDLSGYIDDLRITTGYARYTSNFTPPTSAFKLR
jgi:hypothetical protein